MSHLPPDPAREELDELLGAYALDALDHADRARVDAYLAVNSGARAEVDELRETAASLALLPAASSDVPPELWDRIAGAIAQDRGLDDAGVDTGADEVAARRAKTRSRWVTVSAAAAAVIAVVVLGAQVVSLHDQLDRTRRFGPAATAAAFDRAAKVDGARRADMKSAAGATLARVVLLPDGTGYLRGDHLRPLPAGQTYQLWSVTGSADRPVTVSAGVLGSDPRAVAFHASGPVRAFAVTVERAGGVVRSTRSPVAQAAIT